MIIERKKEETIKMKNGTTLHCFDTVATEKEMKANMEDAEKAFKNNSCLSNKLYWLYAKADYSHATGNRKAAIKYLRDELEMIHDLPNDPETLLGWLDVNSLMAELLIREGELDEALDYAERVIECAENHFSGTLEYIYAEELYATVLALRGETEIAKRWYNDALDGIKGEMADMERLKRNIETSLAELNEE